MKNIAEIYTRPDLYRYLGPARVIEVGPSREWVNIAIHNPEGKQYAQAKPVFPATKDIKSGDTVLVAGDDTLYVMGILDPTPEAETISQKIVLADGASASVEEDANGQVLSVYSGQNELIFQYDPGTSRARIVSNAKSLIIDAEGDIELKAAKQIRLSGHTVDITGQSNIGLSVGRIFENIRSVFSLKPGKINISGQQVQVSAKQGRIFFEDLRNHVKNIVTSAGKVKMIVDRLETAANTVIENAKERYQTTENVNQVKAGRMRMLIQSMFHLGSHTSIIKAKDDVKLQGEKIHLG